MPARNRLRIDGRQAALGLLWQPAQARIPLREQARMAGGPGGGFDLFVPFAGGRQYGFASTKDGLAAKMLAGASLCGRPDWGDNWLAAFAVPSDPTGWWVVAMRGGLVYEDQIHSDEDAARDAFFKSLEAPDWDKTVAPEDWNIEGAENIPLLTSLSSGAAAKLRPVKFWPKLVFAAAAAALAAAGLYQSWSAYSEFRAGQRSEPGKFNLSEPAVTQTVPWKDAPGILDFTVRCERKLSRIGVPVPGWRLQKAECALADSAAVLKLRWQRGSGSASWIKTAASELAGQDAEILNGGQLAEITAAFSMQPEKGTPGAPPLAPGALESLLRDRFLTLGLELKMTPRFGKTRIAADGTVKIDFGYHTVIAATSASPAEHARLLSDIPALVPVSLIFQPRSAGWILTARAYHPVSAPGSALRNWGT